MLKNLVRTAIYLWSLRLLRFKIDISKFQTISCQCWLSEFEVSKVEAEIIPVFKKEEKLHKSN